MASRFLAPLGVGRGGGLQPFGGFPDPFSMLQREMNRLLDDVARDFSGMPTPGMTTGQIIAPPRIDIQERDKDLCVTAEIPGVNESDIQLTVQDDVLLLRGEKKAEREEERGNMHLMERAYGTFQRAIQLPFVPDPEQIDANFRNGVLTITIPKQAQQQERMRRIQVRGAEQPMQGREEGQPGGDGQAAQDKPTAH